MKHPGDPDSCFWCQNVGDAITTEKGLANPSPLSEAGWAAKFLSWVPGVQPTAGAHDPLVGERFLGKSLATNYPTMLPTYGVSIYGSLDNVWLGGRYGGNVSISPIILNSVNVK